MLEPWTIPFDGVTYVCWKDKKGQPKYRPLSYNEEVEYFSTQSKERYLNDILSK